MIVLDEVANDPTALALLLECEAERTGVEGAPRKGMQEQERDRRSAGQRRKERRNDGVKKDQGESEIACAAGENMTFSFHHADTSGKRAHRNASQLRKMSKSLWKYLLSRSWRVCGSSSYSLLRRLDMPGRELNMLGVKLGLRPSARSFGDGASSSSVMTSSSASVAESSIKVGVDEPLKVGSTVESARDWLARLSDGELELTRGKGTRAAIGLRCPYVRSMSVRHPRQSARAQHWQGGWEHFSRGFSK